MNANRYKVVLTGGTELEVLSAYFRDAGCDVPPADVPLEVSRPDFVYDVTAHDAVLSSEIPSFYDEKMEKLCGCRYSVDAIKAIVDEFFWYAESVRTAAAVKKVLSVDADNTLWRGVLSEDGADNLEEYQCFQQGLADLRRDGVLLVALSKNDPVSPFMRPGMKLTDQDFSAMKVNWLAKPANLAEAAEELGVSTDSFVFVDDDARERAEMAAARPEVAVAPFSGFRDLSAGPQSQLLRRLREYFFGGAALTEEDRLRADDYRRRSAVDPSSYLDGEGFLQSLGLWVVPAKAAEEDLDRLQQMSARTNRFNSTGIRRDRESFAAMLNGKSFAVYTFRAGDRFGSQGLVCYAAVDLSARRITDFVMSCRAMGRGLEYFAFSHIVADLGYEPAVDYVDTGRNRAFAEFLENMHSPPRCFYRRKCMI